MAAIFWKKESERIYKVRDSKIVRRRQTAASKQLTAYTAKWTAEEAAAVGEYRKRVCVK